MTCSINGLWKGDEQPAVTLLCGVWRPSPLLIVTLVVHVKQLIQFVCLCLENNF